MTPLEDWAALLSSGPQTFIHIPDPASRDRVFNELTRLLEETLPAIEELDRRESFRARVACLLYMIDPDRTEAFFLPPAEGWPPGPDRLKSFSL